MSDIKIKVPEGGLKAVEQAFREVEDYNCLHASSPTVLQHARVAVESFIRWQKENPPVPSEEDASEIWAMAHNLDRRSETGHAGKDFAVEWVRRMYDDPEPEVDRIDFYVKTSDGYVPWTPTEAQRKMMEFDRNNHLFQGQTHPFNPKHGSCPACAPEPEVPEEIKDLLLSGSKTSMGAGRLESLLSEAYRRGQKSTRESYRFGFTGFKPVDHPILTEWLADAKDKGVDQATQVNYRRLFERAFEAGKKEGHK